MNIYIAGKMSGEPYFAFPAFNAAAEKLRGLGHTVFNPAERATDRYGDALSKTNPDGDHVKARREHGFNLRETLADDLNWICRHADAVALLPGWGASKGANAERATAIALGLLIMDAPA